MRLNWKELSKEEKIAVVRVGAAKKMSASQIAAEMDGCTRNAIIGLANRNDLRLHGSPVAAKKKEPPKPPSWPKMDIAAREALVIDVMDKGLGPVAISKLVEGASPKAIKSFIDRMRVRLRTQPIAKPAEQKPVEQAAPSEPNRDWLSMSPEEKGDFVRKHIREGLSHAEIAALVDGATKKAVAGVCRRQGIKYVTGGSRTVVVTPTPQAMPVVEPVVQTIPESDCSVNILEVKDNQCRTPLWADSPPNRVRSPDEFMFCGRPTKAGSSYCGPCHARFWVSARYDPKNTRRIMHQGYKK